MAATAVLRSPVRMCTLGRSSSESYMRPVTSAVFANSRKMASTNVSRENSTSSVRYLSSHDSLSEEDQHILSLISSIPQRPVSTSDPALNRFKIYDTAAQVYKAARGDGRLPVSLRDKLGKQLKRRVYQLVFEVLHHREVLLDLLVESGFYVRNFKLHAHEELVLIMLYEFQNEKFTLRLPRDHNSTLPADVVTVAEALWDHKVKLGATIARMRVKHKATTITQLIEDQQTRSRLEGARSCLCAARVRQRANGGVASVLEANESLTSVSSPDGLSHGQSFHMAADDLVLFSSDCRPLMDTLSPVEQGTLVPQDLVSYYLVDRAVRRLMEGSSGDVVFTHCQSDAVLCHTADVLAPSGGVLRVFNVPSDSLESLRATLREQGLNNVELSTEPFTAVSSNDEQLSSVRLIVCGAVPQQPHSNTHPVDLVLQEGDDNLCWLSPAAQSTPAHTDRVEDSLTHALNFDHAEYIVSLDTNPSCISDCLEGCEAFVVSAGGPLTVGQEGLCRTEHTITVLNRNRPKPPPPKAVLARAVANGLLGTECLDEEVQIIIPQKQISKKRRTRQARINALHQGIPLTSTSSTERRAGKKKTDDEH